MAIVLWERVRVISVLVLTPEVFLRSAADVVDGQPTFTYTGPLGKAPMVNQSICAHSRSHPHRLQQDPGNRLLWAYRVPSNGHSGLNFQMTALPQTALRLRDIDACSEHKPTLDPALPINF